MPIHLRCQPLEKSEELARCVPIPVAGAEKSDLWLQSLLFPLASPLDSCPLPARPLEALELITPELARVKNK